jgi:hypothetical protein
MKIVLNDKAVLNASVRVAEIKSDFYEHSQSGSSIGAK